MALDQQDSGAQWPGRAWAAVRKDAVIYLAIVAYLLVAAGAAHLAGVGERFSVLVYPGTMLTVVPVMAGSALLVFAAYVVLILKPDSPLAYLWAALHRLVTSEGMMRAFPLLLALTLFFSAVSSFKALIPAFQPFSWDANFIAIERLLHGGRQPWLWLQPLVGYPWATLLINFVYNLWFFVMFLVVFWQLLDVRHEHRRQTFLLSFVLAWTINGSLLAVVFSSAGPCFLDRLFPGEPNPFSDLMAYLNDVNQVLPIWAIPTQDALWSLYENRILGAGAGISAMPSMHVSVAWLIFLLVKKEVVWMRWLGWAFVAFILVGSVHLGWHYAVDGYLSIATTTLIWWLTGVGVRARMARAAGTCRNREVLHSE